MKAKLIKTEVNYILEDDKGVVIASTSLKKEGLSLSLKNCQAIENGYDLDELAKEANGYLYYDSKKENKALAFDDGYRVGFQKALELMSDKKFSEENMRNAYLEGANQALDFNPDSVIDENKYIQSLQQTEWDVEIVYDRDCYSSGGRCDKSTMANCIICTPVTYLKDTDGCLILKRI